MHELSLCADLIGQLEELAARHRARSVARVTLRIGVLSGVAPMLLESAFAIARAGTVAEDAELVAETMTPRVWCEACGLESDAAPAYLRCPVCDGETRLVQGDELILARVELDIEDEALPGGQIGENGE
jgi:hydrogenase nickel incorporation protein HypA/HybF